MSPVSLKRKVILIVCQNIYEYYPGLQEDDDFLLRCELWGMLLFNEASLILSLLIASESLHSYSSYQNLKYLSLKLYDLILLNYLEFLAGGLQAFYLTKIHWDQVS